jgi:hypothetical protein
MLAAAEVSGDVVPRLMESQTTAISIREMMDADLPAVLEIFNREVVESPYLYVETPLTLDERRAWRSVWVEFQFEISQAEESTVDDFTTDPVL